MKIKVTKARRFLKKKSRSKQFRFASTFFVHHRFISFIFKKISNFSVRYSSYVTERNVRAFIVLSFIAIRYLLDFIDFLFWLFIPRHCLEDFKGWDNSAFNTPDFPMRHYHILKIIIEEWWDDELWILRYKMAKRIDKIEWWPSEVLDFIFFT